MRTNHEHAVAKQNPPSPLPDIFGAHLRLLRRRARITQAELGIAVGYSDAQICRLETGRRPPDLTTLVALFFPALQIDPGSAEARHLLALAARARAEAEPEPPRASRDQSGDAALPISPALPPPPTRLIGRQRERALVAGLLADPAARLLTLVGPPGVGKTHLALQIAHDLAGRYDHGAAFVDLSAVGDAGLVVSAIAQALGLSQPESGDPAELLAERRLLLVLDNVEQVAGLGPLLKKLLRAPGVTLLLTSRIALRLAGEQLAPIQPLAVPNLANLPPLAELARIEAMDLLIARLRASNPALELNAANALALAAICVRVDGLPLAIELVAAYGRLFTPQELLSEIAQQFLHMRRRRALPDRHDSLTAALAWSYDQLPPPAQALFDRLSVFVGSWTIEGAVAVCDLDGLGRPAIVEQLDILLDHSLIQQHTLGAAGHCSMLTMMREFARERIQARGEAAALADRLLDFCVGLADTAERQLGYGVDEAAWIARLEVEHDNMRSALRWALDGAGQERGLRLAGSLWRFWYHRGYLREGRRWMETFLNLDLDHAAEAQARAFDGAAILAWRQGEYDQAEAWCERALAIYRRLSHLKGQAQVLGHLGLVSGESGPVERAAAYYEASLPLYRAVGDSAGIAASLHNLGNLYCQQNQNERAAALYEECLEHYRALGSQSGVALVSLGLGAIARDQGAAEHALDLFNQSLELARQLGDDWTVATVMINLGVIALDRHDLSDAQEYFATALELFEAMGDQQSICIVLEHQGTLALIQGDLARATGLFRQSLLLANGLGFQPGIAGSLEGLAGGLSGAEPLLAATLLSGAAALRATSGIPVPLGDLRRHERTLLVARQAAAPAAWDKAWARGAAMPVGRLVALALSSGRS